jgi:hypothetical protein
MNTFKITVAVLSLSLLSVTATHTASTLQTVGALFVAGNFGYSVFQEELPENPNWWQRNITGNVSQKEQYLDKETGKMRVRWTPAHGICGHTLSFVNRYKEAAVIFGGTFAVLSDVQFPHIKQAFSSFAQVGETLRKFAAEHAADAPLFLHKVVKAIKPV